MKLRALLFFSLAFTQVGCFGLLAEKPAETIGGDWTSPLDSDLAVAAPALQTYLKSQNTKAKIIWAGARGTDYGIARGPLGEPLRKTVLAMYAYEMEDSGKCYLMGDGVLAQHTALEREHLGGGQYGPPKLMAWLPVRNDGSPVGREVVCSAVPNAKGGWHGTGDAKTTASTPAKPSADATAVSASTNDAVASATPQTEIEPKTAGPGASIAIAPFTATLSHDRVKKVELKTDGSIFADGKKIGALHGSTVQDAQGSTLLSVLADGNLTSDTAPNMNTRFVAGDLVHREDKVTLSDDGTIVLMKKSGVETMGKIDKGNKAKRTVLVVLTAVALNSKNSH